MSTFFLPCGNPHGQPVARETEWSVTLDCLKPHGILYCLMPGVRDSLAHSPLPLQALTRLLHRDPSSRGSFISVAPVSGVCLVSKSVTHMLLLMGVYIHH